MLNHSDKFLNSLILISDIAIYSVAVSAIVMAIFIIIYIALKSISQITIDIKYIFLVSVISIIFGIVGYVVGFMSSYSRETGNPAILGAILPVIGAAIFSFRDRSAQTAIVATVLSIVFVLNLFSGVSYGGSMRFHLTESFQALKTEALKEYRINIYRGNLNLPNRSNSND